MSFFGCGCGANGYVIVRRYESCRGPGIDGGTGVICKNVVNRAPVDAGNRFATSIDKIFCFTKIVGAKHPTKIIHVWYFDGTERDRVTLSVGGSPWRTYSSKRLRPGDVGSWHVDILDAGGNMLDRVAFDVEP